MGTVLIAGFDSLHVLNPQAEARLEKRMCGRSYEAGDKARVGTKSQQQGDGMGPSTGSRRKELIGTRLGPRKEGWPALRGGWTCDSTKEWNHGWPQGEREARLLGTGE